MRERLRDSLLSLFFFVRSTKNVREDENCKKNRKRSISKRRTHTEKKWTKKAQKSTRESVPCALFVCSSLSLRGEHKNLTLTIYTLTSAHTSEKEREHKMATARGVCRQRDRLVRRALQLSLQMIRQRAHSSLFSSTSYSYSSSASAGAAAAAAVAARLPTPIFDHHRRKNDDDAEEEEVVAIKNEDGTTKPIHDVLSAVRWAKEDAKTKKFDQTVEMSIRLGVNPKRSDMIVRGTCNLPNGTGKKFYVLTFAENEEDREMAREAGADAVGGEELIEQIKSGKFEDLNKVNVCIATPGIVAKLKSSGLARTLGPKGLMPNPKVGTLTAEVGKAVRDAKSGGRVEYRAEKNAIVHAGIGKTSFEDVAIVENATCLMASVLQNRPKGKGAPAMSNYIKKVYLSTTMGKGSRRIDAKELIKLAEEFIQRSK